MKTILFIKIYIGKYILNVKKVQLNLKMFQEYQTIFRNSLHTIVKKEMNIEYVI